MAKESKFPR